MPTRKSLDVYVEQTYPVRCKGRDPEGNEVLARSIKVEVKIYKSPGSNMISSLVKCRYNDGPHGEYCSASKTAPAICAYAFDLPLPRRE